MSLEWYVERLAEVMQETTKAFSIPTAYDCRPERIGLWLTRPSEKPANSSTFTDSKIGFIGIQCQRWFTSHGISLNILPDCLPGFDSIVPCGLDRSQVRITCLKNEMPENGQFKTDNELMERCSDVLVDSFSRVFDVPVSS